MSDHWPNCPLCSEKAISMKSGDGESVARCDTGWCEIETWDPETAGGPSKSIGEVYDDRNSLAIALAVMADEPSGVYSDEDSDWPVVWVGTPKGQVSWHVPPSMLPDEVLARREPVGGYDGHTRQEKNGRLLRWAANAE